MYLYEVYIIITIITYIINEIKVKRNIYMLHVCIFWEKHQKMSLKVNCKQNYNL
jgi:hypothetical protein